MNSNTVIKVNNLSKTYTLKTKATLRHKTATLFRKDHLTKISKDFYALKGVSFSVDRGEGLAVFGMNGSGKTTLLQLLANVMSPTEGNIEVHGHYTALLGANLGLMPTMTGLENIHLMAAMYGVRLDQEPDLLDAIVQFADIGEFINRYVQTYSSGMKARIGFSASVHILPEIVFIDEVLAVGDIYFRKKCQEKMKQLRQEGRTFVIVTQTADNVVELCNRGLWLHHGELLFDGTLDDTWEEYRTFRRESKVAKEKIIQKGV